MRTLLLLFAIGALTACTTAKQGSKTSASEALPIFSFEDPAQDLWQVVNDGVMGGQSKGTHEVADGHLRFTGNLVTQGGGFSCVYAYKALDLSTYTGLELRVRGGGRSFALEVNDIVVKQRVSRRATFPTTAEWTWVRVPFADLSSSYRGQAIDKGPLDATDIRRIGFYMVDGQDGPFELEVDAVRAYKS